MAKPKANSPLFPSDPPAKENTPPSQTSFHPLKTSNSDPPKNREKNLQVGPLVMESLIPFAAFDALEVAEGRAEVWREHCDRQRMRRRRRRRRVVREERRRRREAWEESLYGAPTPFGSDANLDTFKACSN